MTARRNAALAAALASALAWAVPRPGEAADAPRFESAGMAGRVATLAEGLEHPWGMAFLPDGRMLVTERPGRLRVVSRDGSVSAPLGGVPRVHAQGQGGLLDVEVDPDFGRNRLVYLSYAEAGDGGAGTAVAQGRLGSAGLEDVRVILRQSPKVAGDNHWGSRLVFGRDGTLWVTLGDRFDFRNEAQNPANTIGKLVRIAPDGSIPRDNPFRDRAGALPEIWSLGHRNVQGAALHPETGEIWTVEHGARGGDEVNRPQAGRNYGWPVIGYGRHYSGAAIGEGTAKEGMEQPLRHWDPSIAPSGMAFYAGDAFPAWRGDALVGALRGKVLVRLDVEGDAVVSEERLLRDLDERIRDVAVGPDGLVYLLTDHPNGRVLRLEPLGG